MIRAPHRACRASRRRLLAFEGDSHVEWFAGNFSDYEADHKKRLAAAGIDTGPKRIKYKPLVR